jgi:hypothetical protein
MGGFTNKKQKQNKNKNNYKLFNNTILGIKFKINKILYFFIINNS